MALDSELEQPRPKSFQGRPIIKIKWQGKEVEAVQGALAYRIASTKRLSLDEAANGLMVGVLDVRQPDPLGIGVIFTDSDVPVENLASAADRMSSDVLWIEPVLLDHGSLFPDPDDLLFAQQWNLVHIKAVRAWHFWSGDPSRVVLAVLDSGIPIESGSLSHPDLNDASRFILGSDVVNNDSDPADDHGHGTHVTGIAGATKNNGLGVAGLWHGRLLALKVFDNYNQGSSMTFERGVLEAVRFASEQGARLVINFSGGGFEARTKDAAVEHAYNYGALIVAAAGNDDGGSINFPAAYSTRYPNVVAVGAVDRNHQRPYFANRGPEMTVVAPGVDIISSVPNYYVTIGGATKYARMSGTSQATPLVSALAALTWSKWPQLSATEVRDKIIQTAVHLPGQFEDFGHGLINAEAALS